MQAMDWGVSSGQRPHPALERMFAALDRAGIHWCVLRGEDEIHDPPGDVDLLIDVTDRTAAQRVCRQLGFVHLPAWGRGTHEFFFTYDRLTHRWLKLDLVTDFSFGPYQELRTPAAAACLLRRQRSGAHWVLDPDDEFWALLLHCLLDRAAPRDGYASRLQELASGATTEAPLARFVTRSCPAGWSADRVLTCVRGDDWDSLLRLRSRLGSGLSRPERLTIRSRAASNRLTRRVTRPLVGQRRRLPRVALLAPDGAGKTTLTAPGAIDWPVPVRSYYMGLYPANARDHLGALLPGAGLVSRIVRFWIRYAASRYHQLCGRLVLHDRYPYDGLLPGAGVPSRKRFAQRRILARACPAPNLVVVLDAPGEVLHQRKPERSPKELERQRREYLRLRRYLPAGHAPAVAVIDATRSTEAVRRDLTAAVWQTWAARLQSRPS